MLQQVFRAAHFPVEEYAPAHWNLDKSMIGELRTLPYLDQWRVAVEKKWFHVKLEDHSILVFNNTTDEPSYHFLHSPLDVESFRSFLLKRNLHYTQRNKAQYIDEYALALETAPLKNHITPIRFDIDKNAYKPGSHPFAHMHIGLDNSIRIALRRKVSPLAFSLFVMRHMYPESWVQLLSFSDKFKLSKILRDGLEPVEETYWKDSDKYEWHLA